MAACRITNPIKDESVCFEHFIEKKTKMQSCYLKDESVFFDKFSIWLELYATDLSFSRTFLLSLPGFLFVLERANVIIIFLMSESKRVGSFLTSECVNHRSAMEDTAALFSDEFQEKCCSVSSLSL
jgi:hypothetical protein